MSVKIAFLKDEDPTNTSNGSHNSRVINMKIFFVRTNLKIFDHLLWCQFSGMSVELTD